MDYERRQIYRGPEEFVDLPSDPKELEDAIDDALAEHPDNGDVMAAVVLEANAQEDRGGAPERRARRDHRRRPAAGAVGPVGQGAAQDQDPPRRGDPRGEDAQGHLGNHPAARGRRRLRRAGSARRRHPGHGRRLRLQQEQVQPRHAGLAPAGLAASSPSSTRRRWKRASRPTTVVNDAPLFFDAGVTGGQPWEPKNYDGKFEGPMPLHTALAKSKNMVSIRILQAVGTQNAQDWITRFGFDAEKHPPYLTMALGAGSVTPMQMATGYSVFANGGYRVNPWLVTQDHRPEGQGAGRKPAAAAQRVRARHRRAQRLHHEPPAAGDHALRHGRPGAARPQARRPVRQDRHHQRLDRHLVRRLPAHPGRRGLDGLRQRRARWATAKPAAA